MVDTGFESLMYAWAEWASKGKTLYPSTSSMFKTIGTGTGRGVQADIENQIDDIIETLRQGTTKQKAWVTVIEYHYNLAKGVSKLTIKQKAHRIGITETTFYNRRSAAFNYIQKEFYRT